MTDVMNTCDSMVGRATAEKGMPFQIFPDSQERVVKLPSIVVEPTDGGEVESGELRWPPDDLCCPDNDPGEDQAAASGSNLPAGEGDEPEKQMDGVSNCTAPLLQPITVKVSMIDSSRGRV